MKKFICQASYVIWSKAIFFYILFLQRLSALQYYGHPPRLRRLFVWMRREAVHRNRQLVGLPRVRRGRDNVLTAFPWTFPVLQRL